MLRGTLHLIFDDLPTYPGEEMWFPWLDWDVFDHWRFVWEPLGSEWSTDSKQVSASG